MAEIVLLTEDHKFYKDIKQYPKVFRWFTTQKVALYSKGNHIIALTKNGLVIIPPKRAEREITDHSTVMDYIYSAECMY